MIRRFRFRKLSFFEVFPTLLMLVLTFACHSGGNTGRNTSGNSDSDSGGDSGNRNSPPNSPSQASPASDTSSPSRPTQKTILFFGNSLTAGLGVKPEEAFPALIGQRIDSLHLPYRVINAGSSGETTAGGRSRIGWVLRQQVDVFVLELGGNDGLRGIPVSATYDNLQAILDSVKIRYPGCKCLLAGMQIPPSMGNRYATDFKAVFPKLAAKNKLPLIPFLLQGVGGVPELNQADGIHPTARGHRIVCENVWAVLKEILSY